MHTYYVRKDWPVKKILLIPLLLAVCMSIPLSVSAVEDQTGKTVKEIVVLGNRSVDDAVVLSRVKTKVGEPFSQKAANEDLRRLYDLGYFVNISIDIEDFADGIKVAFIVKEKAFLKDIIIEGNKVFKREKILDAMATKINKILDEARIKKDMEEIRKMYEDKGYYSLQLSYKTSIDENTGRAILFINIVEGKKMFVKDIRIEGVKAFKEGQIRKLLKTKTRWLLNAGYLKEEEFKDDLDRIHAFYVSKGYIDMKLKDVKRVFKQDSAELYITIVVEEGKQYIIDKISFKGNKIFPTEDIKKNLKMRTGMIFIPEDYRKDVGAVEDYYTAKGYIEARVKVDTVTNFEAGKIDIVFNIDEGDLFHIEMIDIRGNVVTKDKVIRREIGVKPGDKFDGVKIRRSQQRLENLNYFKAVEIDYEPSPRKGRKNLVFTVEEKKTGELSFGAGFSSIDSLVGFAEISQTNFDFMKFPTFTGAGQKARLRIEGGNKRQEAILSFTEPYFLDKKLAAGFDAFVSNRTYLSDYYDEQRIGFDIRFGKALTEYIRGDVIYTLEDIKLNVDDDASEELKRENGTHSVSKVTFKIDRDTRDSFVYPTRGNRIILINDIAGLGGATYFVKGTARGTQYIPMPWFEGHVLRLTGEVGAVEEYGSSEYVPIFDRYFLGGGNSIRGFKYRKVGPKDSNGEPIGGKVEFFTSMEYDFPIIAMLGGALFYDTGDVYRKMGDVKWDQQCGSIGAGIRLNLPVGPIQLDYGYPIYVDNETKKGNGEISFNVGAQW